MKQFLFTGFLGLALAGLAQAQPTQSFINNGNIVTNIPPAIDAISFVNNGLFEISLNAVTTNQIGTFATFTIQNTLPALDFTDVLYFTNNDTMSCDTGFTFNTQPSGTGSAHYAANFTNSNLGQISAGSASNPFTSLVELIGSSYPTLTIQATNVGNTGLLDVGVDGLLSVDGVNLHLARGLLNIEGLSTFNSILAQDCDFFFGSSFDFGVFPTYWGLGLESNAIPATSFGTVTGLPGPDGGVGLSNAFSSFHLVTNNSYQQGDVDVFPSNAVGYANVINVNASNTLTQVVIVGNANTNVAVDVRFAYPFGFGGQTFQAASMIPVIQWSSTTTNSFGVATSNTLYLADGFGSFTNFQIISNPTLFDSFEFLPYNYTLFETYPCFDSLPIGNTTYSPALISTAGETNQYSAYGANVQGVTFTPDPTVPGQTVTNVPGRIFISASNYLDLTRTVISGPNYLNLTSTNEFVGCSNAQISSPFMDINLGTTNGQMTISNLVAPYVPRLNGPIGIYSARWTNIVAGFTNQYHVLFVASDLGPVADPVVLNCLLRSTNVVISDILNVSSNLLINATSVTISSNSASAPSPIGELNLFTPYIVWSTSFPVLQYFTNWGEVSMSNTVYFLGTRTLPYYSSNFTQPYQSFVNHGLISASGISIWADYFENSGSNQLLTNFITVTVTTNGPYLYSSYGPISLQANTANLSNGTFLSAFGGDMDITSGSLTISNHTLSAYGALTLTVTNLLTDTGTNSSNFWLFANGINLPILPAAGDLLGTTITNTAPAGREVDMVWAGQDRGNNITGFLNDAAVGHLILEGSNTSSVFFFSGPAATNAIYIDLIDLRGGSTNRVSDNENGQIVQTYTAIDVNPGMTVYFADAMANGVEISEKLNGNPTASGGQVIWVPSYAGLFSGTNVTYPSGRTYFLNRALVESTDIDSSGTGTNNAFNPAPVFEGEDIKLALSFTNAPGRSAVISWHTLAGATNYLFTSASLLSTNWSLVTNFVSNANGPVSFTNSAPGNGPRYYNVRVDPTQP